MRTIYAGQYTSPKTVLKWFGQKCVNILQWPHSHPALYNRMSMGGCVPCGQKEKIITEIPQRVTIRSKGRMEKKSNFKNTEFVSDDAKTVTRTQKDAWKCNKILTLSLARGT